MLALSSGNSFYFLQGKGRIESQSPVMVKTFVLRLRFVFIGSSKMGFWETRGLVDLEVSMLGLSCFIQRTERIKKRR